jgi:hypothetical protein
MSTEATPAVIVPGRLLGKKAAKFDRRTLRLARYIEKRRVPVIPRRHNLSKKTLKTFPLLRMMRNDILGDCTCAAIGHMFQTWTVYGLVPWEPDDEAVVEMYNKVNGGVDEGAAMLDVLNAMRKEGMILNGPTIRNRIYAYVSVDPTNHDQLRTAHFLFGGIYIGANLPVSAQGQKLWDVGEGPAAVPGSWGGHAMNVVDYDSGGVTFVTWGALQKATWAWVDRYCDEAYAILEEDYVGEDKRSPQGFSLKRLAKDLLAL